jgi:LmbE family N-acetylglucosaminyl deacetylase
MDRRSFLESAFAAGAFAPRAGMQDAEQRTAEIFLERDLPGQPHKGKVLAAIQPHSDDIPIFAAGTVAKLIREGYTGYLIRTTNDDHAGPGTVGDTVVANELDNIQVAKALGLKKVFDLGYRNHCMEEVDIIEVKARLIFLFRVLKVDTIISYDPWGTYEENPDHYITAQAVEAACWMSGGEKDYPEHLRAGIQPHAVSEKYYHARGPQIVNRIVDISSVIERKIEANLANTAQGPAGNSGVALRDRLAREQRKLPILGSDDRTSNYQYIREFLLDGSRELGRRHGVEYAEAFHHIGPAAGYAPRLEEYIRANAVPLG